ncbi:hypothetical protein ACQ4LE_004423 [Meloidogyne hapla]
MELAVSNNNTRMDSHLVMEKDQRVRYKVCTTDFEVENTSTPDSQNSSIQSRSPRCEAFVMTGDKMLNLNPKISPSYAKMCHDQLPPAVHVEKLKNENHFDHFPSMHKNNHGRIRSAIMLGTTEETNKIDLSTKPESQSETIKEKNSELLNDGQDNKNFESSNTYRSSENSFNVIPADPSNIPQYQTSGNNFAGKDFSIDLPQQQTNLTFNDSLISSSAISRLISSNHSQSMPASPARVLTNKQTNLIEQAVIAATKKDQNINLDDDIPTQICSSSLSMQSSAGTMPFLYSSYPPETISRLARHLFTHQEGIKIAAFLVKTDDLSMKIAREFVNLFNFAGLRIDAALQAFSSRVQFCGDSGDKAQLLAHFAHRYFECNPVIFKNVEEVHALSCALLSLNNSLQGNQANNVNIRDFINDLANSGFKFDPAMLRDLFFTIKNQPLNKQETQLHFNTNSVCKEKRLSKIIFNKKSESSIKTSSSFINPVEQQVDYKRGWLMKKSLYDIDGKRTPIGRRKWQMLYATIRGMVIYLHQDENSFSCRNRYLTYRNCILIHHSLAEVPKDYTKKKNVFRLRTSNFGEFLFQTSDSTEVEKWIDAINYVAAAFSSPVLPTPVGANKAFIFCKPKYFSTPTHLSLPDQLRAHEQRLEETKESLANLQQSAPPMKAKGKLVYDYFYKERFLDSEKERYICYINILREKLNAGTKITSVINNCDTKNTSFNAKRENSITAFDS